MKIGLFEAGLPNCGHDAGSTAVVELCILARSMGHELEYIYTGDNPWGRSTDLADNDIAFSQVATSDSTAKLRIMQQKNIDVAIISRPGPAAEWLHICETAHIPVIYFGHDIHYRRLTLGNDLIAPERRMSARDIKAMQVLEQHIWNKSMAVIYPSRQECDVVNERCKRDHALEMPIYDLLGAYEDFCNITANAKTNNGNSLLFVGGAHHMPNHDAMIWFAQEVLPHLTIDINLYVAGSWPDTVRSEIMNIWTRTARDGQVIKFCGMLSQEDLYNMYHEANLIIAPLRYGAGVKRKVVEALALCHPLLGTSISFEGIELPPKLASKLLSEVDGKDYAEKINSLLATDLQQETELFSRDLRAKYNNDHRKKILERSFSML